ncbi:MAG: hypothetical protein U0703_06830 [Anaerolineae bacterium]
MARAYIGEAPRTFAEITAFFENLMPRHRHRLDPLYGADASAAGAGADQHGLELPWQSAVHAGGCVRLGKPVDDAADLRRLVVRYLAAFNHMTDVQTWSGLKLKGALDAIKPELITYRDEQGVELPDLPDRAAAGRRHARAGALLAGVR